MKRYAYLLGTILLAFAMGSCSSGGGTEVIEEETGALELIANKPEVIINGIDLTTFTVKRGTVDKTATAKIWQLGADGTETEVKSKNFTSTVIGTYTFEARYTDPKGVAMVSPKVTVKAVEIPKEVFLRRVLFQQFTSTQCKYCPAMTSDIESIRKQAEWKDRIVHLTFHSSDMGKNDPMIIPVSDLYTKDLGFEGIPSLVMDLMADTHLRSDSRAMTAQLKRVLTEFPAMCGAAISTSYDAATRQVTITTKVTATKFDEYRVAVYLIENDITSFQIGKGNIYVHNDTVRELVSKSAYGDSLGMIKSNEEKTQTYTTTLKSNWVPEQMYVAVAVIHNVNGSFGVNNSAICPLINGSIDYTYNPTN